MASAYKAAARENDDSDLDDSASETSNESSSTVRAESSSSEASKEQSHDTKSSNLPMELRNRILMLTSRGVSFRHRHLLSDLHSLLPHTYKDTKLDTKSSNNYNAALNSLADLHSCNYVFFLEGRKNGQDLYLWLAKAPNGPTIKFNVTNIHTMGELGFGGNCLKGGRGVVVFDKSFDQDADIGGEESKMLIREMLRGVFCVPSKNIRGMKPFIDRVIGIYGLDGKIWIRIYEIRQNAKENDTAQPLNRTEEYSSQADVSLVEIGPRFVLTPIVILEGSFGGPVIFENKLYVSPNLVRREVRLRKSSKYAKRASNKDERIARMHSFGLGSSAKRKSKSKLDNAVLFG